jgi:hypothetical protein
LGQGVLYLGRIFINYISAKAFAEVVQLGFVHFKVERHTCITVWFGCKNHDATISIVPIECYCCITLCFSSGSWYVSIPSILNSDGNFRSFFSPPSWTVSSGYYAETYEFLTYDGDTYYLPGNGDQVSQKIQFK